MLRWSKPFPVLDRSLFILLPPPCLSYIHNRMPTSIAVWPSRTPFVILTQSTYLTRAESDKRKVMDALCVATSQLQEVLPADCELADPGHP